MSDSLEVKVHYRTILYKFRELLAEVIPKFASRVIDTVKDSKIFNKVKEIRGIPTSQYKPSGNFGYVDAMQNFQ